MWRGADEGRVEGRRMHSRVAGADAEAAHQELGRLLQHVPHLAPPLLHQLLVRLIEANKSPRALPPAPPVMLGAKWPQLRVKAPEGSGESSELILFFKNEEVPQRVPTIPQTKSLFKPSSQAAPLCYVLTDLVQQVKTPETHPPTDAKVIPRFTLLRFSGWSW